MRAARLFVTGGLAVHETRLGYSFCTTSSGRVHGSAATHGLVAHGLNFMGMIEPCGWFLGMFTCNKKGKGMQLKVKDMQLKVSMQKNIGERGSRRDICLLSSSLVFVYAVLLISS